MGKEVQVPSLVLFPGGYPQTLHTFRIKMCQEETEYGVLQNLLQILQNTLKYINDSHEAIFITQEEIT